MQIRWRAYLLVSRHALEERCDPHQADIIVPHHVPCLLVVLGRTELELVAEDYKRVISGYQTYVKHDCSPSKPPRDVLDENGFFSLEYGIV